MVKRIILLSGPVSSGKTTLGDALVDRYRFVRLKTRDLIQRSLGTDIERSALQAAGESLDRKTKGRWVAEELARVALELPDHAEVLVDAVRILSQVEAIRDAFGPRVTHVHLTAPEEELARRYSQRHGEIKELSTYQKVRANRTERRVETLQRIADIVVDTKRATAADVVVRVAAQLGLYGRDYERLVDVMVGGEYGSEGKGHIASYLADEYDVLVRVGGPNAGHKVYEEPRPFTFHHLPSGTRRNNRALIVIGPGAVLNVPGVLDEIAACELDASRVCIDPQAMIIEDEDREKERSLVAKIGSTGQGVGMATSRKILRTDAKPVVRLARDIPDLAPYVRDSRTVLDDAFTARQRVFLEGTQGAGLSIHHGSYPHVTSRDTTVAGCLAEAGIAPSRVRRVIMVVRSYPIRVASPNTGSSGPMSNEITREELSMRSGVPLEEIIKTEKTSTTNKDRRIGEFDWVLLRKAASLNAPTDVALSFADYISVTNKQARRFEQLTPGTINFIEEIERVAAAPVSLISTQFHFRSIIDRRAW
ncbi:MAG: adenylosuccinate synthetase [Gemmatimonadaceae bacterium]